MNLVGNKWDEILDEEYHKDYFKKIVLYINKAYKERQIFPPKNYILRALSLTDYDDVKACLAFLYECQDLTMTELCEKYKLTEKQISNRKYLICKSLQDKKIEYPNVRIRRN